jgi:hypothetical protein
MDIHDRTRKVQALQEIKNKALDMADKGANSFDVRNFVTEGAKKVAYEIPDEEAFHRAASATMAYKQAKGTAF